jgi:hypothetical protein
MEKKFVSGVFVSRKETAPEFVKANLSFTEKFIDYLKENFNAKGYVNLDLKESKEGKLYLDLNDWQPSGDREQFVNNNGQVEVKSREDGFDVSQVTF